MRKLTVVGALCLALTSAPSLASERIVSAAPAFSVGGDAAKAAIDTVDLMGPAGLFPFRGDFENATARPMGSGALPDGWTSIDWRAPANHWHVDTYRNPFTGSAAWCGAMFATCGTDPVGGYGNNWNDAMEFRRPAGPGPVTVRVRARLQYDCEPGYDYVMLQRRTAAAPGFEPIAGGQGLAWDGAGIVDVDYTFTWSADELLGGTDLAFAFVFDADSGWSDSDCLWPSDGAARVDDIIVTIDGVDYAEDFEDGSPAPDWVFTPLAGAGDFTRVWGLLQDRDACASNHSNVVAFLDDGLVVPGVGGTVGAAGYDYATPGGWAVNNSGGLLGRTSFLSAELANELVSPVMPLPAGGPSGVTLAFDVYTHNQLLMSIGAALYTWSIRSTAGGDITQAPWVDRNFIYYGGPAYRREVKVVDDLLVPGATAVQVSLGVYDLNASCDFGCDPGSQGASPAPWFDNVSVKAYPQGGPRIVVTEARLANDGFPASGAIDLANPGANSVRFDMATNISARSHLRNDPGDSIWVDVTPRSGGALSTPVMHWAFAARNPFFGDDVRTALVPGQSSGSVAGRRTYSASGNLVANRWNFDLPDTGMLFPGDVLHYYFSATDVVGGDARTSTAPADLSGFGDPAPLAWPGRYTVNCLPTIRNAAGDQPAVLLWNDAGFDGVEDEWVTALESLGLRRGVHYDLFSTHAPTSGIGDGLGGRATVAQISGYTDLLYTCGTLGTYTLSNGDYNSDPSRDVELLGNWLATGGRDLLLCGEDLVANLQVTGTANRTFVSSTMGLQYVDGDVRDNIGGQVAPTAARVPGNPVFLPLPQWLLYGGCPTPNDFDAVAPLPGAVTLASFMDAGGLAPSPYAAAVLNTTGPGRVITLPYDLSFVMDWDKAPAPQPDRVLLLENILDYFGAPRDLSTSGVSTPAAPAALAVSAQPNPFNPAVVLRWSLPRPGHLAMKVYDVRGTLVRTLIDGPVAATSGVLTWDGANDAGGHAASGLYFVETRAEGQVDVRKVTMIK